MSADVTQLRVAALGVVVPLEVRGAALSRAVQDAWQDALTDLEPTTSPVIAAVGRDSGAPVSGRDIDEVLHHLSPAVTVRAIDASAGKLTMLHAAALGDPATGATAVLVAASGTGKTTAATTLGKRFAYLSDETAGITLGGSVLPYRKPLSIIESTRLKKQRAPSALGLTLAERDWHVSAILLLERQPQHKGAPEVTKLETVDAIAAIAPQSSYLPRFERPLHRLAELVHRVNGAQRVTYSEANDLEDVLVELLGATVR